MTSQTRTDTPSAWDERTQLTTFLDYARATARAKCEDVSAEDARKAPLPGSPLMTLSGLINHLRWVEYYWFQVVFLGEEDEGPWTEEDPDREMRIAVDIPLPQLLDEYEEQSARYRKLVAGSDLDTKAERAGREGRRFDLRWIILHLVEETSRHNGHLDILRELADGRTGD
ncbi:DinB family protein [Streptomyces sp. NPDC005141]